MYRGVFRREESFENALEILRDTEVVPTDDGVNENKEKGEAEFIDFRN